MVANLELSRRDLTDALVIPQNALVRVEEGFVVFVAVEENGQALAQVRPVRLGPSQRNLVVVEEGLAPGDRLIVLGQNQVANGDRIQVVGRGGRQERMPAQRRNPGRRRTMTPGDPGSQRSGAGQPGLAGQGEGDLRVPEDDPAFLARFKEFGITSFAVAHRTSVVMLFLIVSFAGLMAYSTIPKESSPEVAIPMVAVNTLYPGCLPADMETLITRPIEEELNTISEVTEMVSTSVEGYSSISVEFAVGTDLNEALQKVREKVDLARPKLPGGCGRAQPSWSSTSPSSPSCR
jgi:hypothetical protein